jgi:bacteriorhodopsin
MLVRIQYKSLDDNTKRAIEAGQLNKNQLTQINASITEHVNSKKKNVIVSFAIMLILFVFMTFSMLSNTAVQDKTHLFIFIIPVFAMILIMEYVSAWLAYGRLRSQFNKALKKGYPGSYGEFLV